MSFARCGARDVDVAVRKKGLLGTVEVGILTARVICVLSTAKVDWVVIILKMFTGVHSLKKSSRFCFSPPRSRLNGVYGLHDYGK